VNTNVRYRVLDGLAWGCKMDIVLMKWRLATEKLSCGSIAVSVCVDEQLSLLAILRSQL
jgi:hypothetical protein